MNVPGVVSDTGKFRRRYFKSRDEAKTESQRLRKIFAGLHDKAAEIDIVLARDAQAAKGRSFRSVP